MENGEHQMGTAPSIAVIEALSAHYGVDPLDLDPLYEAIDPEALDALFTRDDGSPGLTVQFSYNGCEVEVLEDGTIEISKGVDG